MYIMLCPLTRPCSSRNITDELKQKTCFIITHRRSMLQYCDRVLSLNEKGEMTMSDAPRTAQEAE